MATPENILFQLADIVSEPPDLEGMVRPLLELLETVTGLESTYFTMVNRAENIQKIVYAYNAGDLEIPEGLTVTWDDTLCKRALDEGLNYTADVPGHWGDSEAARELGIQTYLSEPVCIADTELYGTLCAASGSRVESSKESIRVLRLFAQLIARQLEREEMIARLRHLNVEFGKYALSDPLTGVPNRRALLEELGRMQARAEREETAVHVGFIDLDGFKAINDIYGHDAGDRFLIQVARKLGTDLRDGDLLARYGGDEFVVAAMAESPDDEAGREGLRQRLEELVRGHFDLGTITLDYPGASVGVTTSRRDDPNPEHLVARADAAMYVVKRLRQQRTRQEQDTTS